ncbi:alpha/beta fold hydrolase [Ferruginibacter sp. SUN106]|uniref:alpha/beta fold hydrolase n=1 Tax=Ferruginibacter sp. SUN106 TaxID=2978348 RepID=UPI003D359FF7
MKKCKFFLLMFFLFNNNSLFSQNTDAAAMGAVRQKISIREFRGKQITLQATVRVRQIDEKAGAILFLKVVKENGQPGAVFYSNPSIYKNSWNTYSLSGKLDDDADTLSFGSLFSGKAIYSYDSFTLRVNEQIVPCNDNGFESTEDIKSSPWAVPLLPKGFLVNISSAYAFEGKHCLVIDGSGGAELNTPGENDQAGAVANINGVKIYYEIYGSGDPLLLLHGNQQAIGVFKDQVKEFSKYYKVIAVDTRGQGKSTSDDKMYTYDLFADDMNELLNQLHLDSVNIVGWSDGGNTALIMAMKYPAKVKKVVTMGACVFIDKTVVDKKVFRQVNTVIEKLKKDTTGSNLNTIRLYNLLITEPRHSYEDLKAISCPVLVMAGQKDIIKEAHTKGIAAHISKSRLLIAAKQTHYYPVENPAAFNEQVLNFLKEK